MNKHTQTNNERDIEQKIKKDSCETNNEKYNTMTIPEERLSNTPVDKRPGKGRKLS